MNIDMNIEYLYTNNMDNMDSVEDRNEGITIVSTREASCVLEFILGL